MNITKAVILFALSVLFCAGMTLIVYKSTSLSGGEAYLISATISSVMASMLMSRRAGFSDPARTSFYIAFLWSSLGGLVLLWADASRVDVDALPLMCVPSFLAYVVCDLLRHLFRLGALWRNKE